jgi:hypothetical protein
MEWKEVEESNYWNPEKENDEVEGIIVSMENSDFGIRVVIETKDKKNITLPSHKVLQTRLQNCKVGDMIKVVFKGQELPKVKGRNPTNIYKVFVIRQTSIKCLS